MKVLLGGKMQALCGDYQCTIIQVWQKPGHKRKHAMLKFLNAIRAETTVYLISKFLVAKWNQNGLLQHNIRLMMTV